MGKPLEQFHAIVGVPRSGSTLVANVLCQNPEIWVSTHGYVLPALCASASHTLSLAQEWKALRYLDREGEDERAIRTIRATVESWCADDDRPIIIDKQRDWADHALLLSRVFPETKIIALVRDLRDVAASVEYHHRKTAHLDVAPSRLKKRIIHRFDDIFSEGEQKSGVIARALAGLQDLYFRNLPNVLWVKYEDLVRSPKHVFARIYKHLDIPSFEHDFENVANVQVEPDWILDDKFPHRGEGKVESKPSKRDLINSEVYAPLLEGFQWYWKKWYPDALNESAGKATSRGG